MLNTLRNNIGIVGTVACAIALAATLMLAAPAKATSAGAMSGATLPYCNVPGQTFWEGLTTYTSREECAKIKGATWSDDAKPAGSSAPDGMTGDRVTGSPNR